MYVFPFRHIVTYHLKVAELNLASPPDVFVLCLVIALLYNDSLCINMQRFLTFWWRHLHQWTKHWPSRKVIASGWLWVVLRTSNTFAIHYDAGKLVLKLERFGVFPELRKLEIYVLFCASNTYVEMISSKVCRKIGESNEHILIAKYMYRMELRW